jgi:succinoglycan biosynthesis transport protein ExoP
LAPLILKGHRIMQIRHYSWVLWHWRWLILLGTVICAGTTFVISSHLTPVYQAAALVEVNGSGSSSNNDVYSNQALAVSDSLMITSTDVLKEVSQRLPGVSFNQLVSSVSASQQAGSQIIEVRAQASNAQQAADVANEVAKTFIQIQVDKTTAGLQSYSDQLSQNLAAAKANMETAQGQLVALQNSKAPANTISEQEDILTTNQASYNSLLVTYRQVQLQQLQAADMLSVAQTAIPPYAPSSPHIMMNTIVAAAMGLLLMIVLALLLDWVDMTIKTSEDVVQLAGLETLGSVPFSKRPLLFTGSSNPFSANDEVIEQAFVIIDTTFSLLNNGQRTILVTGLKPGAGSTTTAINMATSLALSGKHVLLVDANLRHPKLHDIFHRSNTNGLVNSLTSVHLLQDEMATEWLDQWSTHIPNLWLLPTGPVPAHPVTTLRTPKLRILLEWLLRADQNKLCAIDFIIFDTSALTMGTDTMALAPITDCTVLVIGAGKELGKTLNNVQTMLLKLGSPILGVVINRLKARHRTYFYTEYNQRIATPANSTPANAPVENPWLTASIPPERSSILSTEQETQSSSKQYRVTRRSTSSISYPSENKVMNLPELQLRPQQPMNGSDAHEDGDVQQR